MAHTLITDTVDIFRLERTGNTEAYGPTPVVTGIDCGIFPAGNDILAVYPGMPSFAIFEIYVYEPTTIQNGDKLNSGGTEYIVRGTPQVIDNRYMFTQRLVGEKVV